MTWKDRRSCDPWWHRRYLQEGNTSSRPLALRTRSYWIPGSYAPTWSEKRTSVFRPLKKKGFKEERVTTIGLYNIGTSTTLESNKSHCDKLSDSITPLVYPQLLATKEMTSRQTVGLLESGHDGERRAHSSPEELRVTNDYATFYYGCSSSPISCQCRPQGKVGLQLARSRPSVVSRYDEHD